MGEAPDFVLVEHAAGYGLFRLREFEEVGQILPEVAASTADVKKFGSIVKSESFHWFLNAESALDNCNAISEGAAHSDLLNFLEMNVPKGKKKKTKLGVADTKLGGAIGESLPHIQCMSAGVVAEVLRGLRAHFSTLADAKELNMTKAQLGLGHGYSRSKVKFNVNRVDNMIIQAIALIDQLDKDINTFVMRIREWYSYHFPELFRLVPDQSQYCRCARAIGDRKLMEEAGVEAKLTEILEDEEKVQAIADAAKTSMGMDITVLDLINIQRFADRVTSLMEYRKTLMVYLRDRMKSCAPNLSVLIGELVGARLISHAGSLTNLAKYPASTVQILGAEKALFRALKTRGNTPKYGLLFHSTYIGRAAGRNKGRISRYLANKCSLASRIDCFSEIPVSAYGELLKQQVEDRLAYFDSGKAPKKNLEVMREGAEAAAEMTAKVLKKRKKAEKKAKKEQAEKPMEEEAEQPEETSPKKKKKRQQSMGEEAEAEPEPKKKKKKSEASPDAEEMDVVEETASAKKKKKKRKSKAQDDDE